MIKRERAREREKSASECESNEQTNVQSNHYAVKTTGKSPAKRSNQPTGLCLF